MDIKISYFVETGYVLGHIWDLNFSEGAYPIINIDKEFKSLDELKEYLNPKLKDGSLDGGFGFKDLIGAVIIYKKIKTLFYKGKPYQNIVYKKFFMGDLNIKQKRFLGRVLYEV